MAGKCQGRRIALSPARKLVIELLHHARQVPSIPVVRTMDLAVVAEAREHAVPRPSWTTIFLRAYALVARQHSELRRALLRWPYPHLYEHPHSVGTLVIEREWQEEPILLCARIHAPEDCSLGTLQRHIRHYREDPVSRIGTFRQTLRLGYLPWFVRRFLVWQALHLSGSRRARRLGTFMLSSYGSLGAESLHPLTPLTTLLTFGPVQASGQVNVRIIYDHRVLDGACVARCLRELERTLTTDILGELRAQRRPSWPGLDSPCNGPDLASREPDACPLNESIAPFPLSSPG